MRLLKEEPGRNRSTKPTIAWSDKNFLINFRMEHLKNTCSKISLLYCISSVPDLDQELQEGWGYERNRIIN